MTIPWTIIKWSTFVWMLWLPHALPCKAWKWYSKFGPCQKKHNGKYCGCQSYLSLQETEKIHSCCLHHQNFQKKPSFIVVLTMCSQIASIIALHIDLTVRPSCLELHKRGRGLEDMSSHGGSENDGLKKVKLEYWKNARWFGIPYFEGSLWEGNASIIDENWKECEEDSLWGFARQGPYRDNISILTNIFFNHLILVNFNSFLWQFHYLAIGWKSFKVYHIGRKGPSPYCSFFYLIFLSP